MTIWHSSITNLLLTKGRAQYCLGRCYYHGLGVPKNQAIAIRHFKQAAEQEYPVAQYRLGRCHHEGIGVTQNQALGISFQCFTVLIKKIVLTI